MSSKYNKANINRNTEINFLEIFRAIFIIFIVVGLVWCYFSIYKPNEKKFLYDSRYALEILQSEASDFYKQNGYIYEDINSTVDLFCEHVAKKHTKKHSGYCNISNGVGYTQNFVFKKKKVAIYGMEKKPRMVNGGIAKDFYIDVDGDKGKNTVGVDIMPIRLYSSGRLAGMITPVNCNTEDFRRYGLDISPVCQAGVEINFLDSKIPFSYSIVQIGGNNGRNRYLGKNMSYLRADCKAFGSELLGMDEICEKRGYHWLTGCYHDYLCAIELTKK